MNIEQWQKWLKKYSACEEGFAEAKDKTPNDWFQTTERGDWMIWVLRKLPHYKENKLFWVELAVKCAKEVIHLTKDPQKRPQKAIEAAEKYLIDPSEVNKLLCRDAAAAADAAYAAAAAAAAAAADAATFAATYEAAAAAADAATFATFANFAATFAATYEAAAAAAAAADARKLTKGKITNIIRGLVKTLVIEVTNDN